MVHFSLFQISPAFRKFLNVRKFLQTCPKNVVDSEFRFPPIFTKTLNSPCFGTVLSSPYFRKFPALISWNLHVFLYTLRVFRFPLLLPMCCIYASHYWTPLYEGLLVLCIHACTCRPTFVCM